MCSPSRAVCPWPGAGCDMWRPPADTWADGNTEGHPVLWLPPALSARAQRPHRRRLSVQSRQSLAPHLRPSAWGPCCPQTAAACGHTRECLSDHLGQLWRLGRPSASSLADLVTNLYCYSGNDKRGLIARQFPDQSVISVVGVIPGVPVTRSLVRLLSSMIPHIYYLGLTWPSMLDTRSIINTPVDTYCCSPGCSFTTAQPS